MTRFAILFAVVLSLWPAGAGAQPIPTHVTPAIVAMAWCLPRNAVPNLPARVDPQTGEEWISIDADGLGFDIMWTRRPGPFNFTAIPHHRDQQLYVVFPNQFDRFRGQDSLSQDDEDLVRVFMLMTVGCFSMSDITV